MAEIEIGEGGSGGGEPEGGAPTDGGEARVNELTAWRKRALAAETRAKNAEDQAERERTRADEATRGQAEADEALKAARALHQAGVRSLDEGLSRVKAAREAAPGRGVREIVSDLRRSEPGLFHMRQGVNSAGTGEPRDPLSDLADEARTSGDRHAVLRYLRARRGA